MSTAEIRALWKRIMLGCAVTEHSEEKYLLILSGKELKYLDSLLRSHILWREWLLPGE